MGVLQPHGRGCRLFRRDALTADAPVIVIHSQSHAVAALSAAAAAGCQVILASAPDAGLYGGAGWFREMIAAARAAVPAARSVMLLDCADDAGAAQVAIAAGVEAIVFTGRADAAKRLADIATQTDARLLTARPTIALDLAEDFFGGPDALRRRVADVLASPPPFC
jgi:hypothetical protein